MRPPEPVPPPPTPGPWGGGGFHVSSGDALNHSGARERLTPSQIVDLLPHRGPFVFPMPWGTRGIRLTNETDGVILPVGYSYWRNINQHAAEPYLYVFVGTTEGRPILLKVDKHSGAVHNMGHVDNVRGTGEGWYFSATRPHDLYVYSHHRLCRINVETGENESVFEVAHNLMLWQMHSSDDDQVHAGTLRDGSSYVNVGIVVFRRGKLDLLPLPDGYDECQLDKTGRWLVVKQGPGGADNRIIDFETRQEIILTDEIGAVGHSDTGNGIVVGEDDRHEPGAIVSWLLDNPLAAGRRLHWFLSQWDTGMGHVSVRGGIALVSNAHPVNHPIVNELYTVNLDASMEARVLCPNLADPSTALSYEGKPYANLDPLGQYACWTANGHGRRDAFLVQL